MLLLNILRLIKVWFYALSIFVGLGSLSLDASKKYAEPKPVDSKRQPMLCITEEEESAPKTKTGSLIKTEQKGLALNGNRSFFLGVPKPQVTPTSHLETQRSAVLTENSSSVPLPLSPTPTAKNTEKRPVTPTDTSTPRMAHQDKTNLFNFIASRLIHECQDKSSDVKSKVVYYTANPTTNSKKNKKSKINLNPYYDVQKNKLIALTYEKYVRVELKMGLTSNWNFFSDNDVNSKEAQEQIGKDIDQYLDSKRIFDRKKENECKAFFLHNAIVDLWHPTMADECASCCSAIWCCFNKQQNAMQESLDLDVEEPKTSRSTPKVDKSTGSKANSKEKKS